MKRNMCNLLKLKKRKRFVIRATCGLRFTLFFCVRACACFLSTTTTTVGLQPQKGNMEASAGETLNCPGLTSSAKQL